MAILHYQHTRHAILFAIVWASFHSMGLAVNADSVVRSENSATVGAIQSELQNMQNRIDSILVSCRGGGYSSEYPTGHYAYQVFAAKQPGQLLYISSHGHDHLPWTDDALQQWGFVDHGKFTRYNPVNRTYNTHFIDSSDRLPVGMETPFFFLATGIWPSSKWLPFRLRGQPYALSEVAVSSEYSLRPELEKCGHGLCYVLERAPGDRIWVSLEGGCKIFARELDDPITGRLMQRIELHDHENFGEDIWLPRNVRIIEFDSMSPSSSPKGRVTSDALITIMECEVNNVSDSIFKFTPPAGALNMNVPTLPVQAIPGGLGHLDSLSRWMKRQYRVRNNTSTAFDFVLALTAIAGVLLASVTSFRRCASLRSSACAAPSTSDASFPNPYP